MLLNYHFSINYHANWNNKILVLNWDLSVFIGFCWIRIQPNFDTDPAKLYGSGSATLERRMLHLCSPRRLAGSCCVSSKLGPGSMSSTSCTTWRFHNAATGSILTNFICITSIPVKYKAYSQLCVPGKNMCSNGASYCFYAQCYRVRATHFWLKPEPLRRGNYDSGWACDTLTKLVNYWI